MIKGNIFPIKIKYNIEFLFQFFTYYTLIAPKVNYYYQLYLQLLPNILMPLIIFLISYFAKHNVLVPVSTIINYDYNC